MLEALFGDGATRRALRRAAVARAAALAGGALPASESPDALAAWVDKVARHAWQITDGDVAALRAASTRTPSSR